MLPFRRRHRGPARPRAQPAALPRGADAVWSEASQPFGRSLDTPHFAGRHAGDETVAITRIQLPVAARRDSRSARGQETDAERPVAGAARDARRWPADAAAARRYDPPRARHHDHRERSRDDRKMPNAQAPHEAPMRRIASSSRSSASAISSFECAADMNAASKGEGARYTPSSNAA